MTPDPLALIILHTGSLKSTVCGPRWNRSPIRCLPSKIPSDLIALRSAGSPPFSSVDFVLKNPTKPYHHINTAICAKRELQNILQLPAVEENKHSNLLTLIITLLSSMIRFGNNPVHFLKQSGWLL